MSRIWEEFCSRFAAELEAEAPWPDAFRLALETSPGIPRQTSPSTPVELAAWLSRATSPAWPVDLLADAVATAPDQPELWAMAARRVVLLLDAQDELSDEWQRLTGPVRRSAWLWLGGIPALLICGALQGWSILSSGLGPPGAPIVATLAGALVVGAAVWWWLLLAEADRRTPAKRVRTVANSVPRKLRELSVTR